MTDLAACARLINLATNTVLTTTTRLLDWSVGWVLDGPGTLMIKVNLGEPGSAVAGGDGFGKQLLAGVGGAGAVTTPIPTLLEFGLHGIAGPVLARKPVEAPQRSLRAEELQLSEEGPDIYVLYATLPIYRSTFTDCTLADVLGGLQGTITPIDPLALGFLSPTGALPFQAGLFTARPGWAAWGTSARARLTLTAIVDASVAWLSTDLDSWADTLSKAAQLLTERLGGAVIASDPVPQSARGHIVIDTSDAALNISGTIPGIVADGTPTQGVPQGTGGLSNARLAGADGNPSAHAGLARTIVFGNAGGNPSPSGTFTFDGNSAALVTDETTTARVLRENTAVLPDISDIYGMCSFIGGDSNANFPPGGKITSLVTLNNIPPGNKDNWTDCLPVLGITIGTDNAGGGLYFYMGDGQLYQWPYSPATGILDIQVDNTGNLLYVATRGGVLNHTTDITDVVSPWLLTGGLTAHITKIRASSDGHGGFVLYALAQGNGKGVDGLYRYPALPGAPLGAGYDGWSRVIVADIRDFVATDDLSIWAVLGNHAGAVYQYNAATAQIVNIKALPTGVAADRIDRVITVAAGAHPALDSIWVSTHGDNQGVYFSIYNTTTATWAALSPGNSDLSLISGTGHALQVFRVEGLGLSINGVYTAVFACTNGGLYYASDLTGTNWKSANGQNGLENIGLNGVAGGQSQVLQGIATNRLFAFNDNQFFVSNNSAVHWKDELREPLDLGPYLTNIYVDQQLQHGRGAWNGGTAYTQGDSVTYAGQNWVAAIGSTGVVPGGSSTWVIPDLPHNMMQTIGPMVHSPVGLADTTHVYSPGILPTGWYWERALDSRMCWVYRLANSLAPWPSTQFGQFTDLQTNESVSLNVASLNLARVAIRWLGEHTTPQTRVTVASSCNTQEAGLLRLRPSHKVKLNLTGQIGQLNAAGAVISTTYVDFPNVDMYVLSHSVKMGAGGGSYAQTTTELGVWLRTTDVTGDDIVAGLQDQIKSLKLFGMRATS